MISGWRQQREHNRVIRQQYQLGKTFPPPAFQVPSPSRGMLSPLFRRAVGVFVTMFVGAVYATEQVCQSVSKLR